MLNLTVHRNFNWIYIIISFLAAVYFFSYICQQLCLESVLFAYLSKKDHVLFAAVGIGLTPLHTDERITKLEAMLRIRGGEILTSEAGSGIQNLCILLLWTGAREGVEDGGWSKFHQQENSVS